MKPPSTTSGSANKRSRTKSVFNRDGNKCVWCQSRSCLTLDHIVHRYRGGTNRQSNLQTLCRACNNRRGDTDATIHDLPREYFDHVLGKMKVWSGNIYRIGCSCGYSTIPTYAEACQVLATKHRLEHLPILNLPAGARCLSKSEGFALSAQQIAALAGLTLTDR